MSTQQLIPRRKWAAANVPRQVRIAHLGRKEAFLIDALTTSAEARLLVKWIGAKNTRLSREYVNQSFYEKWRPMRDDNSQSGPTGPTRREFLVSTGSVAAATVIGTCLPIHALGEADQSSSSANESNIEGAVPLTLRVNGKDRQLRIDPRTTLLDCLRETVALTGTKKGCDHGQCGACTVHVNGRRVLSCLTLALLLDRQEITTIEGLGTADSLHPMQAAFLNHDGYQCGYCTSGQIMSAVALLKEPCGPDDAAVKELMSGNICRCGAYANIVAAIQQVRKST
jgi:xanthine dehydrogenase YagT iron-sulfur-binding subunit